jgi:hypothetical protein
MAIRRSAPRRLVVVLCILYNVERECPAALCHVGSTYLYDNYDNLGLINWFLGTMDALHAFLAARSKLVAHTLQICMRAKNSF